MRKHLRKAIAIVSSLAIAVAGISYSPVSVSAGSSAGMTLLSGSGDTVESFADGWKCYYGGAGGTAGVVYYSESGNATNFYIQQTTTATWGIQLWTPVTTLTNGQNYQYTISFSSDKAGYFYVKDDITNSSFDKKTFTAGNNNVTGIIKAGATTRLLLADFTGVASDTTFSNLTVNYSLYNEEIPTEAGQGTVGAWTSLGAWQYYSSQASKIIISGGTSWNDAVVANITKTGWAEGDTQFRTPDYTAAEAGTYTLTLTNHEAGDTSSSYVNVLNSADEVIATSDNINIGGLGGSANSAVTATYTVSVDLEAGDTIHAIYVENWASGGTRTINASIEKTGEGGNGGGGTVSNTTTFPAGYTARDLVWSDEFSGSSLNTNTWNYETGNGNWGWGNNEKEYYTGRTDNVYIADISSLTDDSVDNSALAIKAKRESFGGCNYTSGRIQSSGKQNFKYGYIEAKIKMDNGMTNGIWPAFWLLGQTDQGWPYCGEWDIMEHANTNAYITSTLHWANDNGTEGSYGNGKNFPTGDMNTWHTYGMSWDSSVIKTYLDGVQVFTMARSDTTSELFDNAAYMILNVAVGGQFISNLEPAEAWTDSTMYVDYIRIFQKEDTAGATYNGTWQKDPFWVNYDYDNDISVGGGDEPIEKEPVNNISSWTHVHSAYETNDAIIENTTCTELNTGFKANISTTGWQGLWAAPADYPDAVQAGAYFGDNPHQLYSFATAEIVAGETYNLGFDFVNNMKSESGEATEKNVTITVDSGVAGDNDNTMVSETITIPAGETYHYTTQFTVDQDYALPTIQIKLSYGAYSYSYNAEVEGKTADCAGNPYFLAPGTTEAPSAYGKLTVKNAYCLTDLTNLVVEEEEDYTHFNWTHTHDHWGEWDGVIENTTVDETDTGFEANISITGWEGYWSAPAAYPNAIAAGNYYGDNPYQLTSDSDIAVEPGKTYTLSFDIINAMYADAGGYTEKNVTVTVNSGIAGDTDNTFVYETVCVPAQGTVHYTAEVVVPADYTADTVHIQLAYGCYMYSYTAEVNGITEDCMDNPYLMAPGTTEGVNSTGKLTFNNILFAEAQGEVEDVNVTIDGFQINTTLEGFRTLYSIENDESVQSVGLVYGLTGYVTAEDMIVGSTNDKVHSYQATAAGVASSSDYATQYAMTMKYGTVSSAFLTAGLMVRAYALLSDGTYVYSDVVSTSVYDIADVLYQNRMMNTEAEHDYLYFDILKMITPNYTRIFYFE